jgi:hypothetical protein
VLEPVDLVDGGVFLHGSVGTGEVRLRLVVVVIPDEELDPFFEKLSRISEENWAATDLLRSMIRVGFWTCSIIQAMGSVFPGPGNPTEVWYRSPRNGDPASNGGTAWPFQATRGV